MKAWPQIPLGELCEVTAGGTPSRAVASNFGGDIPWVKIGDMLQGRVVTTEECLSRSGLESGTAKVLPAGTVLMSIFATIGRTAVLGVDAATNQAIAGITPRDINVLLPEYLRRFLDSQAPALERRARGVAQANINSSLLKALPVPLPPLPEQRRTAEILDRADALRTKRRAALAALGALTRSIFLDMFGDPLVNPRSWPKKKLADLGSLDRGVSKHRPRNAPELLGGPYPFVQTGDVANCGGYIRAYSATYSEAGLRQSKLWPAGTLCITIAANIAKTGILTFDACFPDSVVGFRADDAGTVEFVRCWLSFLQTSIEDKAPESAQKNINLEILRGLDVPTPDLRLRAEFARRIEAVEVLKGKERNAQAELDALFASLQHRAFGGAL